MSETNKVPEQVWAMMQAHLGYTDEELELFKADPRNARVMAEAPRMRGTRVKYYKGLGTFDAKESKELFSDSDAHLVPVMYDASSLSRKAMAAATSSGPASRFMMHESMRVSSISFFRACGSGAAPKCISVTMYPGATALTRMP